MDTRPIFLPTTSYDCRNASLGDGEGVRDAELFELLPDEGARVMLLKLQLGVLMKVVPL